MNHILESNTLIAREVLHSADFDFDTLIMMCPNSKRGLALSRLQLQIPVENTSPENMMDDCVLWATEEHTAL